MPLWKREELETHSKNQERSVRRRSKGNEREEFVRERPEYTPRGNASRARLQRTEPSPSTKTPAPRGNGNFFSRPLSRTTDYVQFYVNKMYSPTPAGYRKPKAYGCCGMGCFDSKSAYFIFCAILTILLLTIAFIIGYIYWPRVPIVEFSKARFGSENLHLNFQGMGLLKQLRDGTPYRTLSSKSRLMQEDKLFDPESGKGFSINMELNLYVVSPNFFDFKLKHIKLNATMLDSAGQSVQNVKSEGHVDNVMVVGNRNNTIRIPFKVKYHPSHIRNAAHDHALYTLVKSCGRKIPRSMRLKWRKLMDYQAKLRPPTKEEENENDADGPDSRKSHLGRADDHQDERETRNDDRSEDDDERKNRHHRHEGDNNSDDDSKDENSNSQKDSDDRGNNDFGSETNDNGKNFPNDDSGDQTEKRHRRHHHHEKKESDEKENDDEGRSFDDSKDELQEEENDKKDRKYDDSEGDADEVKGNSDKDEDNVASEKDSQSAGDKDKEGNKEVGEENITAKERKKHLRDSQDEDSSSGEDKDKDNEESDSGKKEEMDESNDNLNQDKKSSLDEKDDFGDEDKKETSRSKKHLTRDKNDFDEDNEKREHKSHRKKHHKSHNRRDSKSKDLDDLDKDISELASRLMKRSHSTSRIRRSSRRSSRSLSEDKTPRRNRDTEKENLDDEGDDSESGSRRSRRRNRRRHKKNRLRNHKTPPLTFEYTIEMVMDGFSTYKPTVFQGTTHLTCTHLFGQNDQSLDESIIV